MELTRRHLIAGAGALPIAARLSAAVTERQGGAAASLPDKASFQDFTGISYLDSGTMHPISKGAKDAVDAYLQARSVPGSAGASVDDDRILGNFARLINAERNEVAFIQSTTTAEHVIVNGLDLGKGDHVVTDTLHFFGSFPLYHGLAERGVDVTWLRPRDGMRISIEDMDRAIRPGTKLVALSLVSTFNGFQHDLRRVCEIAHSRGALVYADIIHAAGCVPIDVKASGVDFAACAGYKWLMADFGLGFVFARRKSQHRLRRTRFGYYGVASFVTHVFPFDPPGTTVVETAMQDNANGLFATGTYSHTAAIHLDHSLQYILGLGVERINAHARPLVARLKEDLPRLGYQVITPGESPAPIVTCVFENARSLAPKLDAAKIKLSLGRNRFRATPSVFNDMDDVDRLLRALPRQS